MKREAGGDGGRCPRPLGRLLWFILYQAMYQHIGRYKVTIPASSAVV